MNKFMISIALALFSQLALADYLGCELEVNYLNFSEEAEYRAQSVNVQGAGFDCMGEIVGDKIKTSLTSIDTLAKASSAGRGRSEVDLVAINPQGDGLDYARCSCGMQ